jgi:ubiquinone/menaquinone biosynthesis C-methylase UbiE
LTEATLAVGAEASIAAASATDISAGMIAIANEKHTARPIPALVFRAATTEALAPEAKPFNAVLGFNYLHLVRDLPGTLRRIHALLAAEGLFISKTPCVGEMNAFIRSALLPAMQAIGRAPYVSAFRATELNQKIGAAGFDIVAVESHSTKDKGRRPYIVARKK